MKQFHNLVKLNNVNPHMIGHQEYFKNNCSLKNTNLCSFIKYLLQSIFDYIDRLEISINYLDENVEFKFKISTSVYPPIRS
jgi:hypothetical protein